MELVYLTLLLGALIAMNWRFIGLDRIFSRSGRTNGTRQCRWKEDAARGEDELARFVCQRCGVDAYTRDGKKPDRCMRAYRDASL